MGWRAARGARGGVRRFGGTARSRHGAARLMCPARPAGTPRDGPGRSQRRTNARAVRSASIASAWSRKLSANLRAASDVIKVTSADGAASITRPSLIHVETLSGH